MSRAGTPARGVERVMVAVTQLRRGGGAKGLQGDGERRTANRELRSATSGNAHMGKYPDNPPFADRCSLFAVYSGHCCVKQ